MTTDRRVRGTRLSTMMALLAVLQFPMPAWAEPIQVGPQASISSLTNAIAVAQPGDTILVAQGVYREPTIVVGKPVVIIGAGRAVLDGQGTRQIMTIIADDVRIENLYFRNVGVSFVEDRAAIKVDGGHDCVIRGNTIESAFFGIYLARSAGCRVEGNHIVGSESSESRSGNGIHAWYCRNLDIRDNMVTGHRDGIYFEFVEDATVAGNTARENLRYGLHFMFSDRCNYLRNAFLHNDAGVAVMYTDDVEMVGNRFEGNWGASAYGLLLKDINDSVVRENVFRRNTVAMYVEGVNRMVVRNNRFEENGWAVKAMANTMDNSFAQNDFVGNAFDVSTNSRNISATFSGNYWDRYTGYDLDRDGRGDVPFRPVRLFSLIVERNEPALILLRSLMVDLLDAAERVVPALTPATLVDTSPRMDPAND